MAEDVRVYEIVTASLSNLNNRQIGFESANDANLGWKMFGGKNGIGEITLFLGKDKAARVSTFGATGDVSIVSGSITINALSLTTAVDNQVMYGDFQQSSAFTYVNGNLGLGVTLKAWDASRSAIQVGGLGALWTATAATVGSATYISNNLYYDGTFKRIINDEVSSYSQSNGIHSWRSDVAAAADVEFTPTAIMQLNAAGFLRLGNTASTNPSYNIDVDRNWNGETIVGIANKNAGSSVKAGLVLETDSAIGWIQVFGSGASNAVLKNTLNVRARSSTRALVLSAEDVTGEIQFFTGGIAVANKRMTLDTAGNLEVRGHISHGVDNKYNYVGMANDAGHTFDGDNWIFNSRIIGSGDFVFQGGNMGIGVTPEAWHSSLTALQVGGIGAVWGATAQAASSYVSLGSNIYTDGSFKRIVNDQCSYYNQIDGKHSWYSDAAGPADIGFTPTLRMQLDASGNFTLGTPEVFKVWSTGHISNTDGMNTTSANMGSGLSTHNYGEGAPDHTNGTGSYDHTGGTYEQLFTKTAGDNFTQNDADTGAFIVMIGGVNNGAAAEIKTYIDGDNVTVFGFNWTGDLASQPFYIYQHPTFVTEDGNITEISAGSTGKLEVVGYQFTGDYVQEIELKSASDDTNALLVNVNANGYNLNDGIHLFYDTGDLQPEDQARGLHIQFDEVSSASADSTTLIELIRLETSSSSDATKNAISVGTGFSNALSVAGELPYFPEYGYTVLSSSVVDRVNSGGGGNDAFVNDAVDQALFSAVNDYFLVGYLVGEGSPSFEVIVVTLSTNGTQNSELEFYYSKTGGNWTQFFPTDGTNGLQNSGNITFSMPGDWTPDDEAEVNGDITNGFYIKIVRTKLGTYTQPIESTIELLDFKDTGMQIKGDGAIALAELADGDATNSSLYFSITQSNVVWKDSGGTVRDLY